MAFKTPPPTPKTPILLSFPTPQILLVTLNRPAQMNCITPAGHVELSAIWRWYDDEPSLRCAVVTGARAEAGPGGKKLKDAFCAGADLKEWQRSASVSTSDNRPITSPPNTGFAGLSTRTGKKPVIAAVHGICLGGGFEAILGCDIVLAHASSTFALPEVSVGVVPLAGVLPRLALNVGMQRASDLALTGRVLSATEALEWGIVSEVVGEEGAEGGKGVVQRAVEVAQKIAGASPDGVVVTRAGLRSAWTGEGVEEAVRRVEEELWRKIEKGENVREGLDAFVNRRKPRWVDSKL